MPSSGDRASESSFVSPVVDQPSRAKLIIRYLFHLNHFFVASYLAITVILIEFYSKDAFWFLYLVPFVVAMLIVETFYLFHRTPPRRLQESNLAPRRLVRRSFIYQLSAMFGGIWIWTYQWDSRVISTFLMMMESLVWCNGVALFLLALVAREYDFLDWVEEPKPENDEEIRLRSEPELEVQPNENYDGDSDTRAKAKRIVRYFLHIIHLSVVILLLDFIWVYSRSYMVSPAGFFLLPFIMVLLVIQILCLLFRRPPEQLDNTFLVPPALLNRAFVYQLAGAYAIVCSGYLLSPDGHRGKQAFLPGFIVWLIGAVLFAIAITGGTYGFGDWFEELQPQGNIRLYDEESADHISHVPPVSL